MVGVPGVLSDMTKLSSRPGGFAAARSPTIPAMGARKPMENRRSPRRGETRGVISLFSGALGLDRGLESQGFKLKVALEADPWAVKTIKANRPRVPVIDRRIEDVEPAEIGQTAGVARGEAAVVSAGPSCQSFSTAGQRRSLDDPRGTLFRYFVETVRELQPRYFVMENVMGVMSAAIQHRPLKERGPGFPPLRPEEEHGSALRLIIDALRELDYYVVFGEMNAADYGAAQVRRRLVFLGSRDGEDVRFPVSTHDKDGSTGLPAWRSLRDGLKGLDDPDPVFEPLSDAKVKILDAIPEGGNWRDLPRRLQRQALGAAAESWGGRSGFFRRLSWDTPAPSLTTRPVSKATMLVHPTETRVLSVREYARLQGFPDDWVFEGFPSHQYVQIGNAVPAAISEAIGAELRRLRRSRRRPDPARKGVVACAQAGLIERFNARPRTVINPPRMRQVKGLRETRAWMAKHGSAKREPLDVEVLEAAA